MGTSHLPHAGDASEEADTRTLRGERRLSGVREHAETQHRRNSPTLDLLRDQLYTTTLADVGGNLTKAAERLGVSRQAIQQYVARKRED